MRRVAGTNLRQRLEELLHSRWFWAGFLLQFASVLIIVLFFINPRWFEWAIGLVEHFDRTIDAPDNWAIALTYLFRSAGLLFAGGLACYATALWRMNGREDGK